MIARPLREAVAQCCPDLAGVVTDGLLKRENLDLLEMLDCEEALQQGILQALRTRGGWKNGLATRRGSADCDDPQPATPLRNTAC